MEYPEHEKLSKIKDKSQIIGTFIDWLNNKKEIHLSRWMRKKGYIWERLIYIDEDIETLIAEFFKIDLKILEKEKIQILEKIRNAIERPF